MIKIGMTNPPYIMSNLPAFVKALNHKNFYSYLHIPVQVIVIFLYYSRVVLTMFFAE